MLTLENTPLILQTRPAFEMTDEQFFEFCKINCNYRIERNAKGELLVMSPVGSETGHYNAKLTQQLGNWSDEDGTGIDFDSSAGFTLPNGANRSPDAAWVKLEKWQAIPLEQRRKFAPICPDFVVELRSPSDNLKPLQEKMEEYIENGASLGWLIDRKNRRVYIYRPQVEVECWESPTMVKGDPILSGFVLKLVKIW
ncbi:Uma2 family endonuclease [Spirulina sp. 06S082]|uniref:Uma2 family endonuclease n=1 Tax=Spirulina sp. 06S082 TaxID=3110248 RepID=UPI002B1FCC76|nr:Uma2 family endonuclease [Spirulina sp. 06S082]MEA5470686.1 Uma2 family endonuclease [Spirulina sp. 06S082]